MSKYFNRTFLFHTRVGRVGLSTLGMGFQKFLRVVVGLLTIPLLLTYLGEVKFALLMAISTFAQWFLIDIGLNQAMKMQLITAAAKKESEREQTIVSTTFFLAVGLVAILGALIMPFFRLLNFSTLFNIQDPFLIDATRTSAFIAVALTLCNIPFLLIREIYSSKQRAYLYSLWAGLSSIIHLAGVGIGIHLKFSVPFLVAVVVGTQLTGNLLAGAFFLYQYPELFPRYGRFSLSEAKRILRQSGQFGIIGMSWVIIHSTDIIFVNYYLGQSQATIYAVTSRLFLLFSTVLSFIAHPFWPAIGDAREQGEVHLVRKISRRLLSAVMSAALAGNLFLLLTGKWIIPFWSGGQVHVSLPLLSGLSVWFVLRSVSDTSTTILNGLGWIKGQVRLTVAQAVLHLMLCALLGRFFGIPGIIAGACLALLLTRGMLLPIRVWKET